MTRHHENTGFVCLHCGTQITPLTNGSYRNHCPHCLYSQHVDIKPGDRGNACRGLMKPVGLRYKGGKGWQIVHHCQKCGKESVNKVAENTEQEDDIQKLAAL